MPLTLIMNMRKVDTCHKIIKEQSFSELGTTTPICLQILLESSTNYRNLNLNGQMQMEANHKVRHTTCPLSPTLSISAHLLPISNYEAVGEVFK